MQRDKYKAMNKKSILLTFVSNKNDNFKNDKSGLATAKFWCCDTFIITVLETFSIQLETAFYRQEKFGQVFVKKFRPAFCKLPGISLCAIVIQGYIIKARIY